MNSNTILGSFLEASNLEAHDARLVAALARAGVGVASALRRGEAVGCSAGPGSREGSVQRNVHGEVVRDIDMLANDRFVDELAKEPCCGGLLSEETRDALDFRAHQPERFVFLDPLDGSANVETHGPTGSIFGVVPWAGSCKASALTPGAELVMAGYLLYSSSTILVLATAQRVDSFVWHPEQGDFVLCDSHMSCPSNGAIYSVNEAHVPRWPARAKTWLSRLKSGQLFQGRQYSQRYAGALVADAHRALIKGGVFAYPADSASARGKLRLQYEVNPMAFIFRAAGGAATTGIESPLDIIPESGHQRSPLVLGSREEVASFEALSFEAVASERLSQRSAE